MADRFACSITPAALDDPRPQRKHDRGPPGRAWLASFAGTALTEGSIRQQGRLRAELAGEPRTPGQRRARRSQRLRTPTSACAARRALGGPSARTRRHATAPARAHVASDCASSARRGSASRARGARRGGGASAPQPSAAGACSVQPVPGRPEIPSTNGANRWTRKINLWTSHRPETEGLSMSAAKAAPHARRETSAHGPTYCHIGSGSIAAREVRR